MIIVFLRSDSNGCSPHPNPNSFATPLLAQLNCLARYKAKLNANLHVHAPPLLLGTDSNGFSIHFWLLHFRARHYPLLYSHYGSKFDRQLPLQVK